MTVTKEQAEYEIQRRIDKAYSIAIEQGKTLHEQVVNNAATQARLRMMRPDATDEALIASVLGDA